MRTSQKLIIGNWKSNFSVAQAKQWASEFTAAREHEHVYVVCPPFPLLSALQDQGFELGVQDLSQYESGAYTGAVSPLNLEGLNVGYVILGHSERRIYFGETSQTVAQKVDLALAHGMRPIVCVDRDQFAEQSSALGGLSSAQREQLIIAYEPVHSISTFGGQEDPIGTTLAAIEDIRRLFEPGLVIYGGSVNSENSITYLQPESIDGVLVGGASLDPKQFAQL
jgi:triosephosphate isomerase